MEQGQLQSAPLGSSPAMTSLQPHVADPISELAGQSSSSSGSGAMDRGVSPSSSGRSSRDTLLPHLKVYGFGDVRLTSVVVGSGHYGTLLEVREEGGVDPGGRCIMSDCCRC